MQPTIVIMNFIYAIGGGVISIECSTNSPMFPTAADFEKVQGSLLVDLVDFPFDFIRV